MAKKGKQKTHSGAKKRFRVTASGKVMRQKAGVRHLLEHKSGTKKAGKRGLAVIASADTARVKEMLGV